MPKRSGLPKGVTEFQDRHGKWHLRFRAKGKPTHYFETRPGQPGFLAEYEQCQKGEPIKKAGKVSAKTPPDSISALISMYYGTPEFTGLEDSSKSTYRGILERFREQHGTKMVATVTRAHIKAILGAMSDRQSAANNLLDRLKMLFRLAMDEGWRTDDPTYRVRGFKITSDGFHTWTEEEIDQYKARHEPGTRPRRALSLLLFTGQRRSDVVKLGKQHREGNRHRVKQKKTGEWVSVPIHPELAAELDLAPQDDMTYMLTEFGKPFTAAGFGNKMREWCDQAGLPQCSAHGLRKAAARRLAEAGCSNSEIKAITGHKTDREVSRYTAAASQLTLSDRAMEALTNREQTLANRQKG